ncbi:hypothetical protein HY637_00550 [Candidatus Woesearchaeota archaeon]|nr:hypothetical protein [Candidatus Woesearchaeota archaeon]
MDRSRRRFIAAASVSAIGSAAKIYGAGQLKLFFDFYLTRVADESLVASDVRINRKALEEALSITKEPNTSFAYVVGDRTIVGDNIPAELKDIGQVFQGADAVVCSPRSKLMELIYNQMPAQEVDLVRENLKYIIFLHGLGFMDGIGPLTRGGCIEGIAALVNIGMPSYGLVHPNLIPSIVGHEAKHAKNDGKELSDLENELTSSVVEDKILSYQLQHQRDPVLDYFHLVMQNRVKTGQFWLRFGPLFSYAYPETVITCRDIWLDEEELRSIADVSFSDSGLENELHLAVEYAKIRGMKRKRERVTEHLYGIANDTSLEPIERTNAALALFSRFRDILEGRGNRNLHPRGRSIVIDTKEPHDTDQIGYGRNAEMMAASANSAVTEQAINPPQFQLRLNFPPLDYLIKNVTPSYASQ